MMWQGLQMVSVKLIFLVRTVVLARLLLPDDFGLLAISLVAVEFLMVVTNLGMTPALVQQPSLEEAHYNAAWTAGMVRAVVVATAVFLTAPLVAGLFEEPRAIPLMQVAALRPVLEAAASIKLARLTRDLNFRALALARLPDVITNTALSIALAPLLGVWALIIGSLAGPLVYTATSYWLAPHRPRFSFDWTAIRPLIRFGRWIFLTGVIALLGRSAMKMIISRELGVTELGLYFLAAKLALIPSEISQEVIHAVAFPLYARLQHDKWQLARAYRAVLVAMMALLLPVCLLLFALSPALVAHVLGPRWQDTVGLIRVLALVNLIGLLGDTVLPIFNGTGRPYRAAMIECLQSSLLLLFTPPLIARYGVLGAALVWLPAVGASQLLCVLFARQIIPRPYQGMMRPAITIGLVAIAGGLLAAGLVRLWPGVIGLVLAGGTAAVVTLALLWLADRILQLGLQANLLLAFPPLARLNFKNDKLFRTAS